MRTRPRVAACVVASVMAAAAAAPARADIVEQRIAREAAATRQARARTEAARRLYQRGDYAGASEAYRDAYRLRPSPGVLFNLGQAYRQDGRCAEAAEAYRGVLASDLDGPARELAAQQLDSVEDCVRAVDRAEERRDRALKHKGVVTMGVGGAALVIAGGLAIADDGRDDGSSSPVAIGLVFGGSAVLATGAVFYVVAQNRLERRQERARPQVGVWRVPVGTTRVAGVTWSF